MTSRDRFIYEFINAIAFTLYGFALGRWGAIGRDFYSSVVFLVPFPLVLANQLIFAKKDKDLHKVPPKC